MVGSAFGAVGRSDDVASAPTCTQTIPETPHTSTQSERSDEATAACTSVGASAPSTKANRVNQVVNRRWARESDMPSVYQLSGETVPGQVARTYPNTILPTDRHSPSQGSNARRRASPALSKP